MPMELPPRRITENGYGHHLKRKQILPRVPEISENAPKPAVIQEQCKDESDNDSESDSEDEEKEPSPPKQRLFKRATRCKIVISTASTTTATIEPTSPSSSVGTSPATINQGNSKSPSTISNLSSPTAGALTKVTQNGHGMSKAMKDAVTATGVIVGITLLGIAAFFVYRRYFKKKHTETSAYGENETVSFGNRFSRQTAQMAPAMPVLSRGFMSHPKIMHQTPPTHHSDRQVTRFISLQVATEPASSFENPFDDRNEMQANADSPRYSFPFRGIETRGDSMADPLNDTASPATGSLARFHTTLSWAENQTARLNTA